MNREIKFKAYIEVKKGLLEDGNVRSWSSGHIN